MVNFVSKKSLFGVIHKNEALNTNLFSLSLR